MGCRPSRDSDSSVDLPRPAMTRKKLATSKAGSPRDSSNAVATKSSHLRSTKRAKAPQHDHRAAREIVTRADPGDGPSSRSSSTSPQTSRKLQQRPGASTNSHGNDSLPRRLGLQRPGSPTLSMFSSYTAQTGTSSSTSRTVTQQSYNQSRAMVKSNVDVFSFLQDEEVQVEETSPEHASVADAQEADWDSDSSSSDESCPDSCGGSCCNTPPDEDTQSVHSTSMWDSGVSMSGDSPMVRRKRPQPIPQAPHWRHTQWQDQIEPNGLGKEGSLREEKTPMPTTFDQCGLEYPYQPPPSAPSPPPAQQGRLQPVDAEQVGVSRNTVPQGHELLASGYCTTTDPTAPTPLYRRFEHLQHRTLLHLQDTIGELEAELKMLDEHIAHMTTDSTGFHHPQSRRLDRIHTGIGGRRHQVLDCLSHYIGQYDLILGAQKVIMKSPQPTGQQIEQSQSWHRHHQPIQTNETGFLQHATDLVCIDHTQLDGSIEAAKATSFIFGALAALGMSLLAMILCKMMY